MKATRHNTLLPPSAPMIGLTHPDPPATTLEVEVRRPVVRHSITVNQIQRWMDSSSKSPSEQLRKDKLKTMLRS